MIFTYIFNTIIMLNLNVYIKKPVIGSYSCISNRGKIMIIMHTNLLLDSNKVVI